jgi:hypothetical protein
VTREQDFERQLADWLGDGPLDAPGRAIDAAVAHARAHPRRERGLGGLWRAAMHVHRGPVASGANRTGILAFAVLALVIVAGLAGAVGGALLTNRGQGNPVAPGPSPAAVAVPSAAASSASPTATPLPAVTAPTPTPVNLAPLHVTGAQSPTTGLACDTYCWIGAIVKASDNRLSGCYIMKPAGSTKDATWGTISFYQGESCSWMPLSPGSDVWNGEWFTAGSRPVLATGFDQSRVYPVDTIWLHGSHANVGLSAVLRMTDDAHLDGWMYTTPAP